MRLSNLLNWKFMAYQTVDILRIMWKRPWPQSQDYMITILIFCYIFGARFGLKSMLSICCKLTSWWDFLRFSVRPSFEDMWWSWRIISDFFFNLSSLAILHHLVAYAFIINVHIVMITLLRFAWSQECKEMYTI